MLLRRSLTLLLLVVSALLLFWRLDGTLLWRDEATTATWARLMAESGSWMPRVFDGSQLIVQADDGHDVSSKMLPAMQGWLQFYISAATFRLLGVSEFTARLPYAIIGAITLWILYRLGLVLFGPGIRPLMLPALMVTSIHFLNAARQSRYYVVVVAIACWLLLEFCRYLREPERAAAWSFYARIGLAGMLLYFSNYVSFVGLWGAVGLFILLTRDRRLIRNFIALSAGMAAVVIIDFLSFHAEFAGEWPPSVAMTLWERYQMALIIRGRDFWRTVPLAFLVPAAFYLYRRHAERIPIALTAALGLASFVVLSPVLLWYDGTQFLDANAALFWFGVLLCLSVPLSLAWLWTRISEPGVWARMTLLGGLIILISPIIAIAAGKEQTSPRHYYQIVPAAVMLTALAAASLERTAGRKAAVPFFAAVLLWPTLDFNQSCCDQIVERQYFRDNSYNAPMISFLQEHVKPGEKVAFVRNVKGMTAYFYLPEMRWVALLNSEAPHNQQFRGKIPDDQFDDYTDVDWYVFWDPRGKKPKNFSEEQYEKVWEYAYVYNSTWWDRNLPPTERKFEIYRRRGEIPPANLLSKPPISN